MARVVMFVLNDVRHDARVRREAATLARAGWAVTIVGRSDGSGTERETLEGVAILRVPIPGAFRNRLVASGGGRRASSGTPVAGPRPTGVAARMGRLVVRLAHALSAVPIVGPAIRGLDLLVRWRLGTEAWAAAAAAAAPAADVWHAHDLTGVPAAEAARRRHGGRLVVDLHELWLEAGDTATRPAWARRVLGRIQRRAMREADAVITVNDAVAAELRRITEPRRLLVLHNTPPAPVHDVDAVVLRDTSPLRAAIGVGPDVPVALYHGSLAPGRGVEVLLGTVRHPGLERLHVVVLGAGPMAAAVETARLGLGGDRIHRLDPVRPDELVDLVAGADVGVMVLAPTTRNHRLSTPNKLFECLAAGVPVVASDFPPIRAIVAADPDAPLGRLVDPEDAAAVGDAIGAIVLAPGAERRALRERCLAAAKERWNWEHEGAGLLALYADLDPARGTVSRGTMVALDRTAARPTRVEVPAVPQRVTVVLPTSGAFDARTRRMAASLGGRGHDVLVIARAEGGLPAAEALAPGVRLVRVAAGDPIPPPAQGRTSLARALAEPRRILRTALRTRRQRLAARVVDRPADIYHAMGFLALPVASDLATRAVAPFVYDARDLYAEGNNVARLPRPIRALFIRRERGWAKRAAAVITVNAALATELATRLGIEAPAVVMNGQARRDGTAPRPADRLRPAAGLPPGTPLVLYHGGFMRDRGLPELIAAMRHPALEGAHLVLMGDGPQAAELSRLAAEPGVEGRVHLLPPVPPEALLEWVAGADVGVMPNQPRTVNERISTPNKLFECLAAGVPVVSSDFPERRRIVLESVHGPLGAVCDPADPAAIGAAIASILDLPPAERDALRARCAVAAATSWSWETQFETLLEVYERVTGSPW